MAGKGPTAKRLLIQRRQPKMKKTIIFCLVLLLVFTADAAVQKQTKSIHEAARDGDIAQVQSHFLRGANIDETDEDGFTALHLAASGGHKGVAEMLIASGANVNANSRKFRSTPLHHAAGKGHKDVAQLLIDKGANVNAKDNKQRTPLRLAADGNHREIVELLIAKGADVNAKQDYGRTLVHSAAYAGHKDVAELLIEKGADINAKDSFGQTALHLAARYGHANVAELLIAKGGDINVKDRLGLTPLHSAALGGHSSVAQNLIAKGADVNAKQIGDITPLHLAARSGHKAMVELLADKKADVNAKHGDGWTPLHEAAVGGHRDVAELLIAKGADVNAKDKTGWTPLRRAKEQGHRQVVELLLKRGAIGDASIRIADKSLPPAEKEKQAPKQIIDISSIAKIDPLDDPNAAKARLRKFEGLEEALKNVEKESQKVTTEWVSGLTGSTPTLIKAVYEQVGAEFEFVRKQAVEEAAEKMTAAIDGLLVSRKERFDRIVERMQQEQKRREERESRRTRTSRRSTRGRTGTMDSGYNRGRYQDTMRQDRRRSPQDMTTSRQPWTNVSLKLPFNDPNDVKIRLKDFQGLQIALKTVDRTGAREVREWMRTLNETTPMLAKTVYTQVAAELKFTRKLAIEEKAAKTAVAIDGLLVSRQERFGRLARRMLEEKRNLRRVERRPGRIGTRR